MQGLVVVHKGKIVFEQYPGMRPDDYHVWMSTTKTVASLMLRLLAEGLPNKAIARRLDGSAYHPGDARAAQIVKEFKQFSKVK